MSEDRELDIVVFGATGFVGRLVAGYLAGHAPGGARIGLAGRSERRLADVRAGLGAAASAWPLLVADSADPVSVAALARAARVVVSTVGPYRTRGLALVEACAAAGTDYADLTGEVLFIRDSIDCCHDAATAAGARIVHCCGFDSVPSDLGVLLLHHAARADDAGELQDTTLMVAALRGGVSGGTLASLMGQQDEVRASAECRRVVGDPYALSPDRAAEPDLGDERDLDWVRYDGELRTWVGPFVMAGLNTRVVRRSNALQGWAYGRRFRYREVTGFGASPAAPVLGAAVSAALKAAEAGLAFGPSRALLSQLLPAPGQGPGENIRRTGYFRMQIHTRTSAGARYLGTIAAHGDPGYAATSVMLGETALCLALDRDRLPDRAGVLTPATAMGAALADRLRSAGHTLATRQVTRLPLHTPTFCLLSRPARCALAAAAGIKATRQPDRANHAGHDSTGATVAPGRGHVSAEAACEILPKALPRRRLTKLRRTFPVRRWPGGPPASDPQKRRLACRAMFMQAGPLLAVSNPDRQGCQERRRDVLGLSARQQQLMGRFRFRCLAVRAEYLECSVLIDRWSSSWTPCAVRPFPLSCCQRPQVLSGTLTAQTQGIP